MRLLIVDDEPLIRRSLQKAFESKGHTVYLAEDGFMGLEQWRLHKPDLVMLDVLMPGLTGPQILDEIGQTHGAKVVMMSAYSGDARTNLNIELFLKKPFEDIFKVISMVEALVNE